MVNVNDFIDELSSLLSKIDSEVDHIEKELVATKKPIHSFVRGENVPGVYVFFIKPKLEINIYGFEDKWIDKKIINYPKIVRSRFQVSTQEKKETYTLYLGKSEKVDSRINEHLTHTSQITTYSLKLIDRLELIKDNDLYYSSYEMKELVGLDSSIIQFVITRIESKLRSKMNPWVGKQ